MIKLELSEQEAYTLNTLLTWDVLVNRDNIFKATGDLSVLEEVNKKIRYSYCTRHGPEFD